MNKDAVAKAATTKKMNQLAGSRLSLPGHNHHREAALPAELTASFQPQGAVEMLWVHDIAYCAAIMEVIAAQVSGLQRHHLRRACTEALERTAGTELGFTPPVNISPEERVWLGYLAEGDFTASHNNTLLNDAIFATLLGSVRKDEIDLSRMLQQLLHDERKERDRIINQFERRRRNAMRDAIEQAEEARRAEAFTRLCAEDTSSVAPEGASPKMIEGSTVDHALMDRDGLDQSDDAAVIEVPDVSGTR